MDAEKLRKINPFNRNGFVVNYTDRNGRAKTRLADTEEKANEAAGKLAELGFSDITVEKSL